MEKYKEKHMLAYIADSVAKAAINEDLRTIRFVISSAELDRDNEIVETSAVAGAIKDFAKNPVCLACHQHRLDNGMPPVVGAWDTDTFVVNEKRCEMDLRFADTDLAETYWKLYKGKFMKAVSIGFRVLEFKEEMKDGKRYWIITKIELHEISCVPVGANRQALSKVKGLAEPILAEDRAQELQLSISKMIDDRFCQMEDALTAQIDEIKDMIIPEPDALSESLLGGDDELDAPGGNDKDSEQKIVNQLTQLLTKMKSET